MPAMSVNRRSVKGHPGIQVYEAKRALPSKNKRYIATAFWNGERHYSPKPAFLTIAAAEAWKREEEAAMRGGQSNLSRLTLAEYIDKRWWPDILEGAKPSGEKRANNTIKTFESHVARLKHFLGTKRLRDIMPTDIDDFKRQMRDEGVGQAAQLHAFNRLRQVLKYATDRRVLLFDPSQSIAKPVAPKSREPQFPPELLEAIIAEAEASWWETFVKLAMLTGLTFSELGNLLWADIDFAEATLQVTQGKTRKRVGKLGLPQPLVAMLQQHRYVQAKHFVDLGSAPPVHVFTHEDGLSVRQMRFRDWWLPMRNRLNVPWLHFHDLRHVTASVTAAAGIPDAVRQDLMRHATDKMTRLYTQTDLTQQREAIAAAYQRLGL